MDRATLERRLSRRTTSGRIIREIDGLRFVAITFVVLFHLGGLVKAHAAGGTSSLLRVVNTGGYGVQLFFVVSGFVLSLPFAAHRLRNGRVVSLRAYFLRRLTRLEPPYIVVMAV